MVQQDMQRETATTEIHLHQNQRTQTARQEDSSPRHKISHQPRNQVPV